MEPVRCFMIEPTGRAERFLRRYTHYAEGSCPAHGWGHNARRRIEDGPIVVAEDGTYSVDTMPHSHDDERWPERCGCGYYFQDSDEWQLLTSRLYKRPGTGELTTLEDAPVGAMWYAGWLSTHAAEKGRSGPGTFAGPDWRCLMVKVPGGREFCVDGPARNGAGWERTGVPPDVTATPSIWVDAPHGWHGFLTDGWLKSL
jgi:hypothetical protein